LPIWPISHMGAGVDCGLKDLQVSARLHQVEHVKSRAAEAIELDDAYVAPLDEFQDGRQLDLTLPGRGYLLAAAAVR
jgi:hypothetical protein